MTVWPRTGCGLKAVNQRINASHERPTEIGGIPPVRGAPQRAFPLFYWDRPLFSVVVNSLCAWAYLVTGFARR